MLSYTQTKIAPRYKNYLWRFNMIVEREQYLNELIKKKDNGRIKIITGIEYVESLIYYLNYIKIIY